MTRWLIAFCGARKDSVNVKDETVEYNFAGDPNTWTPWIAGEEQGESVILALLSRIIRRPKCRRCLPSV